jgi:xanthine dehydrogenase accessory factor
MRRSSWADHALALVRAGEAASLITIVHVSGSAPREAGAKMVVGATEAWGTIGGGNLEWIAIEQARKLAAHDGAAFLQQDYPLGPLLAQ